jgi:hypothetical protein
MNVRDSFNCALRTYRQNCCAVLGAKRRLRLLSTQVLRETELAGPVGQLSCRA